MSKKNMQVHENLTKKYGEFFCASPWNSLHEGPEGLTSTCCKTRVPIGYSTKNSYEEMYNSEHAKSVRKDFLEGKKPQQCSACWDLETDGKPSLNRVHGNTMSTEKVIDDLVAATDKDGTLHKHKPEWLDMLWTSKCNFACLGCSPDLSSTINNKYKKEFAILHGGNMRKYFPDMTNWDNGSQHKIDYILKHSDTIRSIHLNGGEPFMNQDTYELLEELLKRGLHKKIQIWSHTNGSITKSYKGADIVEDYLVHWGQNAKVTMSNDGFGAMGEYIRWGYKDKKWLSTYEKVRDSGVVLTIQTCWNIFNSLYIEEMGEWFLDNCKWAPFNPPFDKPDGSLTIWMDYSVCPDMLNYIPELKQQGINSLKNTLKNRNHPLSWTENLNRWIDWLAGPSRKNLQAKAYSLEGKVDNLKDWFNGCTALDQKRGTNLCRDIPRLAPLYELGNEVVN